MLYMSHVISNMHTCQPWYLYMQDNLTHLACIGTLMLYLVQCKSIANWLNLQHFYNILVKYTTVVFGIFCVTP